MNAHQRKLSRQQARREERERAKRLQQAKRRDVDADGPFYVSALPDGEAAREVGG